jgi:hypothetical protein
MNKLDNVATFSASALRAGFKLESFVELGEGVLRVVEVVLRSRFCESE